MASDFMADLIANAMAKGEAEQGVEAGTYYTDDRGPGLWDQIGAVGDAVMSSNPVLGMGANFGAGLIHGDDYVAQKERFADVREQMVEGSGLDDMYAASAGTKLVGDVTLGLPAKLMQYNKGVGTLGAGAHEAIASLWNGLF